MANVLRISSDGLKQTIDLINKNYAIVAAEVKAHKTILETLLANPHMKGASESIQLVVEKSNSANAALAQKVTDYVEVLKKVTVAATEIELKFQKEFKNIAENFPIPEDYETASYSPGSSYTR